MADDVTPEAVVTPADFDFAADEIGGVMYPRTKLIHGADGVNAGDVSAANPLPVAPIAGGVGVAGGAGDVTALTQRTTLASDDPAVASLGVLDDWDESDRAKVNPIVGQAGVAAGAGAVGATVQRMTLASDDPAVASLAIIDDWDESDRAKVNPIVGQAGVAAGAGTVDGTTQRMTLANDDPAVVSLGLLDDWDESDRAKVNLIAAQVGISGGAGSVAANTPRVTLASDDPAAASLGVLDDWDEADRAKVNPIVGQAGVAGGAGAVGATVQRMTLASDDPAVTALQIIDDWDESDRCKTNTRLEAHTAGGASMHKTVSAASTNATVVKNGAGQIYGIQVTSVNAAARYLKLYDKATTPTVGSDTPVKTLVIPGNTAGAGFVIAWPAGLVFSSGISFALTTEAADNGTTGVSASEHVVNIDYK